MNYYITISATGSDETRDKEYRSPESGLRGGKLLLKNQAYGTVAVYGEGDHDPVRYARKTGWKWENIEV